jgi:hypothetical protein
MKRAISLTPLRNAPPLSFEYDGETGAISRPDAQLAADFIVSAERMRFVVIPPYPSSYRLGPAPHSLADLAAIFTEFYALPEWLESERPIGESDEDETAAIS